MLLQIGQLTPDDTGDHIAHAVVIAQFFVLIPGSVLTALGGPLSGLVGGFQVIGQQHTAGRTGDDLIAVEGDDTQIAEGAGLPTLVGCAHGLSSILNEDRAVTVADGTDLIHLAGDTVKVCHHHKLHIGVQFKSLLQSHGVHVPGVVLGIDKDRHSALVDHGVNGCCKGHIGAEDLVPRLHARQFHAKMQRSCTGRQRHRILAAQLFRHDSLHLVDILANGGHPVGLISFLHILQFFSVHSGRRQPYFIFQRFDFHDIVLFYVVHGKIPLFSVFFIKKPYSVIMTS